MKNWQDLRILFVEDEPIMQKSIKKLMEKHIAEFYTASNGEEGLNAFYDLKPDIVITDLDMPIMSGSQMINRIRQNDLNTPIIMITAFEDQSSSVKGADYSIIKPVMKTRLFELVELCAEKLT